MLKNFLDVYVDAPSEHRDSVSARLAYLKAIDGEWADAVASEAIRLGINRKERD